MLYLYRVHIFSGSAHTQHCISQQHVCDGIPDCHDGDDESDCHRHLCPVGCLCNNHIIQCQKKKLHKIPTHSTSQRYLLMSNNSLRVDRYTLEYYTSLVQIDFSFNSLSKLDYVFTNQQFLIELNVSHNEIVYIRKINFETLTNLMTLDISFNKIRLLSNNIFDPLSSLMSLHVEYNHIKQIGSQIFHDNLTMQSIYLRGNYLSRKKIALDTFGSLTLVHTLYPDEAFLCCFVPKYNQCIPLDVSGLETVCNSLLNISLLRIICWCYTTIIILSNTLALILNMAKHSEKQTVRHVIIMQQHLTDLLMGLYMLSISSIDQWYGQLYFIHSPDVTSSPMCQFIASFSMFSLHTSTLWIFVNAFICYLVVIKYPFRKNLISVKLIWTIVVLINIFSVLVTFLPIILLSSVGNYVVQSELCLVFNAPKGALGYQIFIILYVVFGSIIILIAGQILYTRITIFVTRNTIRKTSKRKMRNNNLFVITNIFSWITLLIFMCSSYTHVNIAQHYKIVVLTVMPVNACINPFMFTYHVYIIRFVKFITEHVKEK